MHRSFHADKIKRTITTGTYGDIKPYSMFLLASVFQELHFHSLFTQNGHKKRISGHFHYPQRLIFWPRNGENREFWPNIRIFDRFSDDIRHL